MAKQTNKNQLGKGIRALLSSMDESDKQATNLVATGGVHEIPVSAITVNPFQPRSSFDSDALKELTESIKLHGLIQPITVRRLTKDSFQLISGERRWRASKAAGLEMIPAYVREADDQGMLEMALVENVQRENLNAIEVAVSLERLIQECSLTHEDVSARIGKNRSTVTNYLRLLKLPPEVQNAIKKDQISMGHARAIAGVHDLLIQKRVFDTVINQDLSVRKTEDLIRSYQTRKPPSKTKVVQKDVELEAVEKHLKSIFGNPVIISKSKAGKGKIEIHFKDSDNLHYILDKLDELA